MSTNELDRLIAKTVSRITYEYDAGDWEKVTAQLAAARRKKRTVALAYCSSGIAAGIAIFLIGIVPMFFKKDVPALQYASGLHIPAPLMRSTNGNGNGQLPGARHTGYYRPYVVLATKKQICPAPLAVTYNAPIILYNNPGGNIAAPAEKKRIDTSGSEPKNRAQGNGEPGSLRYAEAKNKPDQRRINISVAGGVNYGTINTGYAIGAAVGKKMSNKLGIELTVAYIGNTSSNSGGQGTGGFLPVSPAPIVTAPLNYLQFSPMADYSLSKKITLAAGADLQRLLQEHAVTVLYEDQTRIAPILDLGLLVRTEYAVFPRFKAGVAYRFGANNIIAPGNNYLERNYLQVLLKYKLR